MAELTHSRIMKMLIATCGEKKKVFKMKMVIKQDKKWAKCNTKTCTIFMKKGESK